jgi:folate-binding protein YgfZ
LSCYCASLDKEEALLHLRGPDALTFLQGQVTCDTRKLGAGTAMPGVYCTIQGRVVCDFLLCELEAEHLVLRMRRDIRAASAALFGKYIVFSRAQLEAERDDWRIIACWGATAGAVLGELFGAIPREKFGSCRGRGFAIVQLDKAGEQFECYLEQATAGDLSERLQASMLPASQTQWQALQIAAGSARIEAATSGEYIPQMLNYDVTGHISFRKGCYTGQEVVARMHYRGKPKRRLYPAQVALAALPAGRRPEPGSPLYLAGGAQAAGNVINSVATEDGRLVLLVTATSEGLRTGLHLPGADGPALSIGPAPYPLPETTA